MPQKKKSKATCTKAKSRDSLTSGGIKMVMTNGYQTQYTAVTNY